MTAEENLDSPGKTGTDHARKYQVVWDRKRSRYQVVRNDGSSLGYFGYKGGAIAAAMHCAIEDAAMGVRASVLVQQRGGFFTVEWAAPSNEVRQDVGCHHE